MIPTITTGTPIAPIYFPHNSPMKRHCQFTVKRFEVNYSRTRNLLTVSQEPYPCKKTNQLLPGAANCSERDHAFLSIQLHLVTLSCGSLIGHEDFKAHSLRVRLLRNKWIC